MNYPTIVYLEAALMENGEIIHYGESLGFACKRQMDMVESSACKLTKGDEPVVSLSKDPA